MAAASCIHWFSSNRPDEIDGESFAAHGAADGILLTISAQNNGTPIPLEYARQMYAAASSSPVHLEPTIHCEQWPSLYPGQTVLPMFSSRLVGLFQYSCEPLIVKLIPGVHLSESNIFFHTSQRLEVPSSLQRLAI